MHIYVYIHVVIYIVFNKYTYIAQRYYSNIVSYRDYKILQQLLFFKASLMYNLYTKSCVFNVYNLS